MDRVLSGILDRVSASNGVSRDVVEDIYLDMFDFIKSKIEAVNFDDIHSEADLLNANTNFNVPRIIKLYTTLDRINYVRRKAEEKIAASGQGSDIDNSTKEEV